MLINRCKTAFLDLWKTERPLLFVWFGVIAYTVFFSMISFFRYEAFSYTDFDFAMYVHEAWKIAHGSLKSSIFNDTPIYGVYLEFISCLIAPVFVLSQFDPRSLLFLQALLLGLGALPVYWIAREKHSGVVSALLSYSYLFYPALWYTNLYEFYPVVFSTFLFLLMFYFMEKGRFNAFMCVLLIVLSVRVDMTITIFMYGVYALFSRRGWKWVIAPCLISMIWFYVGMFLIIPKFQGNINFAKITYSYLGGNFNEVIYNIFNNPKLWMNVVFSDLSHNFILELLIPLLFFPLGAVKEILFCLPSLSQHLLSARWQEHTIHFHYTATITPFLFISTIYALHRHFKREHIKVIVALVIFAAILVSNFLFGPLSKVSSYQSDVWVEDLDRYKKYLTQKIPTNANTISTFEFSARLAGRERYYSMHYIYWGHYDDGANYVPPADIEYALVDFNDPRMLSFDTPDSDLNLRRFLDDGWGVIDSVESIVLFKRDMANESKAYQVKSVSQPYSKDSVMARFDNYFDLTGLAADVENENGFRKVNLKYRFNVLNSVNKELKVFVRILDDKGKAVYTNFWDTCYGIYPVTRWNANEEIECRYSVLVPKNVVPGTYTLTFALLDIGTKTVIGVRYPGTPVEERKGHFMTQVIIP